jgi:hypothetical protein
MFSEDLGSCIPAWKNPSRTSGCKWGLLKAREIQMEQVEMQAEFAGTERAYFSFFGCL